MKRQYIYEENDNMKKFITITMLVLAMVFVCTGCGLFSDESVVKLDDTFTHNDPKDLTYDTRIVLKNENFGSRIEDSANEAAYPDTMMYDDDGNMIGMYDYDAETGLAKGWTNITDGTYTAYEAGKEVDLGKPDESKMVSISGDVKLGFVVYGNKDAAVSAYMYILLSDASSKDVVENVMESVYGITMTEDSDTVLKFVQDQAYIDDQFKIEEDYGYTFDKKDAAAYADILKQAYGVTEYGGENPYKPYDGHKDPEDLDFDERVVLTGSGSAAVTEEYEGDIKSMTDYVYGKDGDVVAQYSYYEGTSKESTDTLMEKCFAEANPIRVSDTVIEIVTDGQDLQDMITAYIGYNVLKDRSVDDYVRMLQETFFTSIYE